MRAPTCGVLVASLLTACAGVQPRAGPGVIDGDGWSIRFPGGWLARAVEGGATASRLGARLERIEVRILPPGDATLEAGSPADTARLLHARLAQDRGDTDVALLSAAEVRFAEHPGVRAELAFRDAKGLRHRALLLGARADDGWRFVAYEAAELRYFARGLPGFEEVASTFQVRPRGPVDAGAAGVGR